MFRNKSFAFTLVISFVIFSVLCAVGINKITDKKSVREVNNIESNLNVLECGMGNIVNGGYVNQQDNWLFYSNGGYSPINKLNLNDGERITYDYFGGSHINVVDDWIYYIAISQACGHEIIKMKTDGTNRIKLINSMSDFLYVKGEWIYYTEMNTGNLFRANLDGANIEKISDDYCMFVNIVGNEIYYSNLSDNKKIYRIINNEKTKLTEDTCTCINVVNNNIYFINDSDGNKVYRVNTEGKEKTVIINQKCTSINVSGDLIYYTIFDDDNIYLAKLDGTDQKTIFVNFRTTTPCLSIFEDWIYYFSPADEYKICKVKSDGTGKTVLD